MRAAGCSQGGGRRQSSCQVPTTACSSLQAAHSPAFTVQPIHLFLFGTKKRGSSVLLYTDLRAMKTVGASLKKCLAHEAYHAPAKLPIGLIRVHGIEVWDFGLVICWVHSYFTAASAGVALHLRVKQQSADVDCFNVGSRIENSKEVISVLDLEC